MSRERVNAMFPARTRTGKAPAMMAGVVCLMSSGWAQGDEVPRDATPHERESHAALHIHFGASRARGECDALVGTSRTPDAVEAFCASFSSLHEHAARTVEAVRTPRTSALHFSRLAATVGITSARLYSLKAGGEWKDLRAADALLEALRTRLEEWSVLVNPTP